jgi:hypothetical protein
MKANYRKRVNPFEKFLTKENKFQRSVAQWLNLQYPNLLWWHTPNEGKRSKFEQWLAKILGIRAGVSDIIILHPNKQFHGIAMELKVAPNKATSAQLKFLKQAEQAGFYTCIAYNIEEVMQIISSYLRDI